MNKTKNPSDIDIGNTCAPKTVAWRLKSTMPEFLKQSALKAAIRVRSDLLRQGISARCFCFAKRVELEIYGLSRKDVNTWVKQLDGLVSWASVTQIEPNDREKLMRNEYCKERLTKSFLFSLPQGAIIVTTECDEERFPRFCDQVGPKRSREALWKEIIDFGVDNSVCEVFWSFEDAEEWCGVRFRTMNLGKRRTAEWTKPDVPAGNGMGDREEVKTWVAQFILDNLEAPGQGKMPDSVTSDVICEYLGLRFEDGKVPLWLSRHVAACLREIGAHRGKKSAWLVGVTPGFLRRRACYHEAGHAVTASLMGMIVSRIEIWPEREFLKLEREFFGVCVPKRQRISWLDSKPDKQEFWAAHMNCTSTQEGEEMQRFARGYAAMLMAGWVTERMFWGGLADSNTQELVDAKSIAGFFGDPEKEFQRLVSITTDTLGRPDIWRMVVRLAEELERRGKMTTLVVHRFLPPVEGGFVENHAGAGYGF